MRGGGSAARYVVLGGAADRDKARRLGARGPAEVVGTQSRAADCSWLAQHVLQAIGAALRLDSGILDMAVASSERSAPGARGAAPG